MGNQDSDHELKPPATFYHCNNAHAVHVFYQSHLCDAEMKFIIVFSPHVEQWQKHRSCESARAAW